MSEISYQNQDLENVNPLHVSEEITDQKQPTKKFSLPSDPKLKLLLILCIVVVVLFFISIVITIVRGIKPAPIEPKTTPTPRVTPLPTEIADINKIPNDLKQKFNQVDTDTQIKINFPPPQIDTEIGQ